MDFAGDGADAEGVDEGVLVFQCGDQRVWGVVVDDLDFGAGIDLMRTRAAEDGDLEAGVEELSDNGWSEVTGALGRIRIKVGVWESYIERTPATATRVIAIDELDG